MMIMPVTIAQYRRFAKATRREIALGAAVRAGRRSPGSQRHLGRRRGVLRVGGWPPADGGGVGSTRRAAAGDGLKYPWGDSINHDNAELQKEPAAATGGSTPRPSARSMRTPRPVRHGRERLGVVRRTCTGDKYYARLACDRPARSLVGKLTGCCAGGLVGVRTGVPAHLAPRAGSGHRAGSKAAGSAAFGPGSRNPQAEEPGEERSAAPFAAEVDP